MPHQNEAWSFPSPATVGSGNFLKPSRRSTSLAVGSSIPRSLAAAPAVGGWGIIDPRLVHSVGSSRKHVGGVVEAVVRSAWRVATDLVPFDGGALRSFAVEILSFLSSQVYRSVELVRPYPASVWRPARNLLNKEEEKKWSLTMKMESLGVSSLELTTGDFPAAEGMYLIQAIERYGGGIELGIVIGILWS